MKGRSWRKGSREIRARKGVKFWVVVFFLVGVVSATAEAGEESPTVEGGAVDGGLLVSGDVFVPLRTSVYNPFVQPSVGYVLDRRRLFVEVQTMALSVPLRPVLVAANMLWADLSPYTGRSEWLAVQGRWALWGDERFKVDIGPTAEWVSMSGGYFPATMDGEESLLDVASADVSTSLVNAGVSVGIGVRLKRMGMNVAASGGNGWSEFSTVNPFVGLDGTLRVVARNLGGLAIMVSSAVRVQHMNFEGFEMPQWLDADAYDVPGAKWLPSMNIQIGVVIPLFRTAGESTQGAVARRNEE